MFVAQVRQSDSQVTSQYHLGSQIAKLRIGLWFQQLAVLQLVAFE